MKTIISEKERKTLFAKCNENGVFAVKFDLKKNARINIVSRIFKKTTSER